MKFLITKLDANLWKMKIYVPHGYADTKEEADKFVEEANTEINCAEHDLPHFQYSPLKKVKSKKELELENKFIVRLYDGFDRLWIDISKPVIEEEAQKIWDEKTDFGKKGTAYKDIDYYKIFPADSKMVYRSY